MHISGLYIIAFALKNFTYIREGKTQSQQGDSYMHEKLYTPSSSKLLGKEKNNFWRATMQKLKRLPKEKELRI